MRGIAGSLSRPSVSFETPGQAEAGSGRLSRAGGRARESYTGRLSTSVGSSGGGVSDRTVGGRSTGLSDGQRVGLEYRAPGSQLGIPTTGIGQQVLAGDRLTSTVQPVALDRQGFGIRGETADDQDYGSLLASSRATYDQARAAALQQFGSQQGEDRIAYDARVAEQRAAHEKLYASQVASARIAYDTKTGLAQTAYDQRVKSADGNYAYLNSRPSNTTFTPAYKRLVLDEYQATRAPFRADPFVSPAPEYTPPVFEGPEFSYPDYVAPERQGQFQAPTGTPITPYAPEFNPLPDASTVPQGVQWYSAAGGYHFRPEDIISQDAKKIQARATRYNGYQSPRTFNVSQVYNQTSPLTQDALDDYSIYSGNIR